MRGGRGLKDIGLMALKYRSRLREELRQPSFLCQVDLKAGAGGRADYEDSQKVCD